MKQNKDFRKYYDILNKIGEGFGDVYEAKIKKSNEKRAIKIIDKKQIKNYLKIIYLREPTPQEIKNYMECFFKEINYMILGEGLNGENENSVKFYEFFDTEKELAIVMELCDENMLSYISGKTSGLNTKEIFKLLRLLNNTFKIMNENKMIYKDLKLKNILLKHNNGNYTVKLKLNYGNSLITNLRRVLSSSSNMHYCNNFNAPEILEGDEYDEKCDLWSLGVIIYILCFKKYPFRGVTEDAILYEINKNGQECLQKTGNDKLDDLISKLLIKDPKKRISWKEYFIHPFIIDFREYYEIGNKIEEDGFGTIYKANIKETGELRAIKIYDKNKLREIFMKEYFKAPTDEEIKPYIDDFMNEVNNMKIIEGKNGENKNTVKLYNYFDTPDEFAIVMEICDDNLLNIISQKKESFTPEEVFTILEQLNNSFEIMAENKIIHRTLNLEKILIKYENEEKTKYIIKLKLTDDSGLKNYYSNISSLCRKKRNIKMMAPELLKKNNNYNDYSEKCDLWSLGIIIHVLTFKRYPYTGDNIYAILNQIKNCEKKILKKTGNEKLDYLIHNLLTEDPKKRLSWHQYFILSKTQDYKKYYYNLKKIGQGGYGAVYEATKKNTNEKRAIKIFDKKTIRQDLLQNKLSMPSEEEIKKYFDDLFNEVENMRIAEGPNNENKNTVKFYEYFNNENEFAIVMELCDENLIENLANNKRFYNTKEIKELLNQLNNTFKIMDEELMAHRDLKLQNILVKYEKNGKPIFKIADYGLSKKLSSISKKFSTRCGTYSFMAPEVLEGDNYNLECDLWSLGIIIYVLYFNKYPYSAENIIGLYNQIKKIGQKILAKTENPFLDDLIRKLLIADPEKRITWKQYFKHKFFDSIPNIKNKITIKLKVGEKDKIGDKFNNIYFLGKTLKEDKINKEINDNNCLIYINDNIIHFDFCFNPRQEGDYEIIIYFTNKINNCSYMFNKCNNIESLDLSSFDASNVTDMSYMFSECCNLKEININNINTDNVKYMNYMFNQCSNLEIIIFPNSFNTENVENISFMFHSCEKLFGLNFSSNFKTNNVNNMKGMFKNCFQLIQLDLSNFNTEKVKDMSYMFDECKKLEEIVLNPIIFKTDNVIYMNRMFSECLSLVSIDLSSFNIGKVKYMDYMFNNCEKITAIEFSNSMNNEEAVMNKMFKDCDNLKIINLSSFRINDKNKIEGMFDNLKNIEIIFVNNNYIKKYKEYFPLIENKFSTI